MGSFQLYALDWVMDTSGNLSLLECNAAPGMLDYSYVKGDTLTPGLWTSMLQLVALAQSASPQRLRSLSARGAQPFHFAGWELLFNELTSPRAYNACSVPMQAAM